jgi:uncharacterized protein DUF4953/uncharacterized protein DUF5117
MKVDLISLRALVVGLALIATPALAAHPPKVKAGDKPADKADAAAAGAQADKPYGDWKKLTKDTEVLTGYFNIYRKRENVYLEIRPDQLEKPVLGIFSFSRGIGTDFTLGGLPLNDRLIEFQRSGDRILVLERNPRFSATGGAMEKALQLSMGPSVLASLKVESVNDSTKAVLVDFAQFLVSDVSDLTEWLRNTTDKSVRFDKERSAVTSVKVFPENVECEALLTYTPNDRRDLNLEGVADPRFIPIGVHYSFSKLPDVPMKPRMADDRVGYFLTTKKDFGRDSQENFFVRMAEHWRLEKKDPTAALSDPIKPIVYYIDRTVPEEYRPAVKEGIEKWQKAFEGAGFKNAIIAKDAPDDPNWDPEDVRYSTVRWITSTVPTFGAIGPSRVDPRTGEILDADVLFEASFLQNFRNAYRRYSGPDAIANEMLPELRMQQFPKWLPLDRRCDAAMGAADGGALIHMALLMDGTLPPGSPVPEKFMHDAVVWATMHEIGHTLGLRHNFRSSTSTPYDKLQDKEWVEQHGLYGSVMEYPSPNISLDRTKQGYYYTQGAGTEDLWRIRYAYTPSGKSDLLEDYAFARAIADENLEPGHEYSTDDDTYPATALDPRSNIWDLGDNPLQFAKDRTSYIASLWKNPAFESRILGDHGEYPSLKRAMDTLIGQYAIALGVAVKYVGGSNLNRVHRGQPDAVDPLVPVSAAKQREALEFLSNRAFAANAFAIAPQLINRLAPDRWAHWGVPDMYAPNADRLDYDLTGRALAIQNTLLNALTSPRLLQRVRESEARTAEPFRLADHLNTMTRMLWGEVAGGEGTAAAFKALDGPTTRRELQRAYVDRLASIVVGATQGVPDDARGLARLQLTRIDGRCARVLASEQPLSDTIRAHLVESRARIKRALEAGRDADVPRPAVGGGPVAAPNN